jgi:hypothetical protein
LKNIYLVHREYIPLKGRDMKREKHRNSEEEEGEEDGVIKRKWEKDNIL